MKSHSNNLNAAADLIRNLDVALSNMTAAANTASNDAAKARRNAKAAGEVARRYLSKGGGSGRKNNKQRAVAADNNNNLLLEKKREKRNAARIAAEVRQRREHPYNNYSSSSPSRLLGSPTTRRLGTPSRIFVERGDKVGSEGCEEGEEGLLLDKTVAAIQSRANQLEEANNKKKRQVVHGYNSANISDDANCHHAESEKVNTARITENIPLPVVEPTLEATTSLGSTYTEFEDAMEEEHNHYHYEGNETNMESVEGGSSIGQQPMMMGGDEVQIMADAEEDELKVQPVLQPPPTNNEYYNQQTSYYQSGDQAADGIDMGPQNFYKQDQEVQQNNNMVYNDFHQDENEQYYNEQQQTETEHREKQHHHASSTPKKAKMSVVSTLSTPKHSIPPTPPRSQPTSTNRIEASHAEDVLTLSLELERLRSELATTTEQLTNATRENETLNVELTNIQSQCNLNNESTNAQLATLQQQLQNEQRKSKAAEEDAALALELAKDAQTTKEECEVWLSRSLEEIDLWKNKCLDMEQKFSSSKIMMEEGEEGGEEEKHVRFKDDCPPSPVVSEDGTFGLDDEDTDIDNNASSPMIKSTPPQPPPPPPPTPSTPAVDGAWSTPEDSKHMGMMMFSPTTLLSSETTPSKEAAVATGRAFFHRMTTPSSLSSSSPYASRGGLSPHPRLQASELLKKSAETRRLLRERLTPGRNGKLPRPPTTARIDDDAKSSNPNNNTDDNAFASRQGAACKAVGKTIRESGARLKLNGKWWGGDVDHGATKLLTFDGSGTNSGEEGTIEELESMVKDYTANVEGTIGQQRTKIDELLAFCDHLEKEVMIM